MTRQTATQTQQQTPTTSLLSRGSILQRKCESCGQHTIAGGECGECTKKKSGLQRKLAIGASNDPLEWEADRVADRVMAASAHSAVSEAPPRIQRFTGQLTEGSESAPASIDHVLSSPGRPLEPSLHRDMGQRFGHDFSRVRVHTDAAAERSARDVNANAYTVGHNIVFGARQFAPGTHEGRRLIAHELTHVVQQSGSDGIPVGQNNEQGGLSPIYLHTHRIQQQADLTNLTVQRDVIDDTRKKLSYGVFDWAITDTEAMEALAELGKIPSANLANELKRLGSKYVTRLLDNLPDAAKTGEVYKRVIEALKPAEIVSYAKDQLSRGFLDWAITDTEVTRVFNTFVNLPAAAQEQFLVDLNAAGHLGRLISNASTGHHALYIRPWIVTLTRGLLSEQQRKILRTIVEETSNDALETLKLATETRFNVVVGKTAQSDLREFAVEWEPDSIRQVYLVLDELPEAHVARNKELRSFGQFKLESKQDKFKGAASNLVTLKEGVYDSSLRELAINSGASKSTTIRHEAAHAVDQEMHWSTGSEPRKLERGGWEIYGDQYKKCADKMVDDSGGAIKTTLTPPQRTDVVNEMANAMESRTVQGLEGGIRNLAWFAGLKAAHKKELLSDRALSALEVGLTQPWFKAEGGGVPLGSKKHIYQESYLKEWVSYSYEARKLRGLSDYQFRDPWEWFAEVYAFYYDPDPRGRGAKVADKDKNTKEYFDKHVHTRLPSR